MRGWRRARDVIQEQEVLIHQSDNRGMEGNELMDLCSRELLEMAEQGPPLLNWVILPDKALCTLEK